MLLFIFKMLSYYNEKKILKKGVIYAAPCILKSLSSKNIWTLLKPYNYITYVHPKLEFNTLVYSLLILNEIYICSLESVQKNFTRKICIHCNIPFSLYIDWLSKLNLKSSDYRSLEFDLILTYCIQFVIIQDMLILMISFNMVELVTSCIDIVMFLDAIVIFSVIESFQFEICCLSQLFHLLHYR